MALTVSTDAIIEKLSGTAGADSQVHSITSGQIIVCVGGKVVDGGTKQFTVKVMHPDATAAQAAELARPIIKGLLGQAVTAGETAAAQEAEREHLQDTKLFSANQLGRIFTGWAGWLDTLRANKMLEADEERRDEVASAQVKISGANEALKMFRKLPQCKEAEEGHVVAAEVLKVADEMPAFGAASIATSTRIQMFFGALNAVILSERHSAMLEEIAGKDSVSVDEMQTLVGASARVSPPTSCAVRWINNSTRRRSAAPTCGRPFLSGSRDCSEAPSSPSDKRNGTPRRICLGPTSPTSPSRRPWS